jgi:hypothetical protein
VKLFEEYREQEEEEEEGKAGRFARKGKHHGQGSKVVAGGDCWVRDGVMNAKGGLRTKKRTEILLVRKAVLDEMSEMMMRVHSKLSRLPSPIADILYQICVTKHYRTLN